MDQVPWPFRVDQTCCRSLEVWWARCDGLIRRPPAQRRRPGRPKFQQTPYNEYLAYGRPKTATILFAVEFDCRYTPKGIRAAAVHPGAIQTETVHKLIESLGAGKDAAVAAYEWKTVPQGAATSVWTGFVAPADEVGARHREDCHVAEVKDDPSAKIGVRSYALNQERAKALWAQGEEMAEEKFSTTQTEQEVAQIR